MPFQNLVAGTHAVGILEAVKLALSLCLAYAALPEQPAQFGVGGLVYHPLRHLPRVLLNHQQVLRVMVGGEEKVASQQLQCNAPNRPHIGDLVPVTALENDLGRAVLPCADDCGVGLAEESGPTEVDDPDLERGGQPVGVALRGVLLQLLALQQYVFGLEVGVGVAQPVQEPYAFEDLAKEVLDSPDGETAVAVLFDEFVEGESERLEDEAEVGAVVERALVPHNTLLIIVVTLIYRLDNLLFCFGRLDVLVHTADHLI